MNRNLPPGWEWTTISDVAEIQLGRQRSPQHHSGSQMRPYLRSANVTWDGINLDDVKEMNFDDSDFKKYRLWRGDLLLNEASGSPNEVGKPALWNDEIEGCCFQNTLLRLRPHEVGRAYLYWYCYLAARTGRFGDAGRGVNIRHLGKRGLSQFPIPIAPMAEQKRIVDAIEEHFSHLDAAEATLSATSRKLDAWLTSFLTDACRGPWPKAQLSDIIKSLNNGVFVSRPSAQPPGSPIYRISAVRPLVLRTDDIRYADPVPKMADAYKVESGDILLTRYSGNPRFVGAAAVVPPGGAGILHPDKLIRVVADRSKALPGWIAAYLTVGEGRRGIEQRLKTTAGQVGISGSQLRTVQIAVPPLSHQQKMITKLGVLREAQERMQQQLDGVATQTQALRRSIIAAGFAGRLVPQDPEDEPASVLLERIAASRPTMPARQRRTA